MTDFIITQYPDRNFNTFFNDQGRDKSIIYRQVKDRLISFNKDMKIYVWDVVTGKLKSADPIKGLEDINNFTQMTPRGYDTTLFYSNNPISDTADKYEDFYDAKLLAGNFKG